MATIHIWLLQTRVKAVMRATDGPLSTRKWPANWALSFWNIYFDFEHFMCSFYARRSRKSKKDWHVECLFCALGICARKRSFRTLVKLTPEVWLVGSRRRRPRPPKFLLSLFLKKVWVQCFKPLSYKLIIFLRLMQSEVTDRQMFDFSWNSPSPNSFLYQCWIPEWVRMHAPKKEFHFLPLALRLM